MVKAPDWYRNDLISLSLDCVEGVTRTKPEDAYALFLEGAWDGKGMVEYRRPYGTGVFGFDKIVPLMGGLVYEVSNSINPRVSDWISAGKAAVFGIKMNPHGR